jgi:hypothetical protein
MGFMSCAGLNRDAACDYMYMEEAVWHQHHVEGVALNDGLHG